MVVSRSCDGFISPRPLKRVTVGLARGLLLLDLLQQLVALAVVEGVVAPACRHRCGTAAASPRTRGRAPPAAGSAAGTARTAASRCAGRRSRRPRGCRSCRSAGRQIGASRDRRRARRDVVHLLADGELPAGSTSQVFRILPRSGRIAWKSLSRACLAEPPAESPSTRNSSRALGLLADAVGELAGQRRAPRSRVLRSTCCAALARSCALSMASCAIRSPASGCWLSHSANAVVRDALDEARRHRARRGAP